MHRISRYLLLLALLGLQQTATHAALRGTTQNGANIAAVQQEEGASSRASRYRVYDVQAMAGGAHGELLCAT